MSDGVAQSFWILIGVYTALGLLFALPFVVRGVNRIDPSAATGSWGFRLLVLPGCVALWPLLLKRWLRKEPPPTEHNAHRGESTEART